jgi:cellulose synthase/poly-beta-1,6-N-acetylglucosamine synthase-like glycosyltransferase
MADVEAPSAAPLFSIIIAVYNDRAALNACLRSIAEQTNAPSHEVIVVDDGSVEEPPESTRSSGTRYPCANRCPQSWKYALAPLRSAACSNATSKCMAPRLSGFDTAMMRLFAKPGSVISSSTRALE